MGWFWLLAASVPPLTLIGRRLQIAEATGWSPPDSLTEIALQPPLLGWSYELQPAGQSGEIPLRLRLAPGLNRLEIWRGNGPRRRFLFWGSARQSHYSIELKEGPDGPVIESTQILDLPSVPRLQLTAAGPAPGLPSKSAEPAADAPADEKGPAA